LERDAVGICRGTETKKVYKAREKEEELEKRRKIVEDIYKVRFEGFTAVNMKNAGFWDVTSCGSCKKRRFEGTYLLQYQGEKNQRARKIVSRNSSNYL
jgi:hypothetical protein